MAAFYPLFLTLFPYRVQVNYLLFLFRARTFILPPSLLAFVFEEKLGLGVGAAARFAKAPVGTITFLGVPKKLSAKRGGRPAASAWPHGNTTALWFHEAQRCPRAPAGA